MEIIYKILPILSIFVLGSLLRKTGVAKREDGNFLLRLNFYVSLPALTILSLSNTPLSWALVYFPIIGVTSVLVNYVFALTWGKKFAFDPQTLGVFIIGSMIINTGFALPFITAAYGQDGLIRKIIFDLGSDTMIYTFIYYLACQYGGTKQNNIVLLKKLISSPILFSFVLGILLTFFSIRLPEIINNFLTPLSNLVIGSILLALGIYFQPRLWNLSKTSFLPLIIRSFGGLCLGLILVNLFQLQGLDQDVALILASAPIGYSTLTLSSLEKLNTDYAANIVSMSVFSAIIYIPILLVLFTHL